jgi:hypothetical protein
MLIDAGTAVGVREGVGVAGERSGDERPDPQAASRADRTRGIKVDRRIFKLPSGATSPSG